MKTLSASFPHHHSRATPVTPEIRLVRHSCGNLRLIWQLCGCRGSLTRQIRQASFAARGHVRAQSIRRQREIPASPSANISPPASSRRQKPPQSQRPSTNVCACSWAELYHISPSGNRHSPASPPAPRFSGRGGISRHYTPHPSPAPPLSVMPETRLDRGSLAVLASACG